MEQKRVAKVLDINGTYDECPDFPVAVVRPRVESENSIEGDIVDPVFTTPLYNNLFGRVMTLLEATCETHKLKAVKDLFGKELISWYEDVFQSARELVPHEGESNSTPRRNLYTKGMDL
jgi:hypothetical protein